MVRTPALFAGVLAVAVVLGLAAGSRALFVSSAASAALAQDVDRGCPYDVGLQLSRVAAVPGSTTPTSGAQLRPPADLADGGAALDRAVAGTPGLNPRVETLLAGRGDVASGRQQSGQGEVAFMARTGSAAHVDVVARNDRAGLWLPDTTARQLQVTAGDQVTVQGVPVPVEAVFRDLAHVRRDRFWCSLESSFQAVGKDNPPPVALADRDVMLGLLRTLRAPTVQVRWEYPIRSGGLTLRRARLTAAGLDAVDSQLRDPSSSLSGRLGLGPSHLDLPASVRHASNAKDAVDASIGPVSLASAGVALLVIVAAGGLWFDRRRRELVLLTAKGVGAVLLAVKAVLEMGGPVAVGAAGGLGLAVPLVRGLGPSTLIDPDAFRPAALVVILGVAAALGAIAGIVGARVRALGAEPGASAATSRRGWLWEPVVLAVAAASLYEIRTRAAYTPGSTGSRPDSLLLLFPVLLLAGGSGLLARLALGAPARMRSAGRTWPTSAWLAVRRLAGSRARAATMLTGVAVSLGIVVFGATVAGSLRATLRAKTTLAPGAEQVLTLQNPAPVPADSAFASVTTAVTRTKEDSALDLGHASADVLGVEPATFARGAYWDRSFADVSLGDLLHRLAPTAATADSVPVVVAGAGVPDHLTLSVPAQSGSVRIPARVVGRADAFPGQQAGRPLVVFDRAALTRVGVVEVPELWVGSNDRSAVADLSGRGVPVLGVVRAEDGLQSGSLLPQLWSLRYLQLVGLAAGAVTVCGLVLYLGVTVRAQRLGVAIARFMGLRRRAELAAIAAEVGFILLGGLVLGTALAWLAARLVFSRLDPLPGVPPGALLRPDLVVVGLCGVIAAGLTVVLAVGAANVSRRTPLTELLRRGE